VAEGSFNDVNLQKSAILEEEKKFVEDKVY